MSFKFFAITMVLILIPNIIASSSKITSKKPSSSQSTTQKKINQSNGKISSTSINSSIAPIKTAAPVRSSIISSIQNSSKPSKSSLYTSSTISLHQNPSFSQIHTNLKKSSATSSNNQSLSSSGTPVKKTAPTKNFTLSSNKNLSNPSKNSAYNSSTISLHQDISFNPLRKNSLDLKTFSPISSKYQNKTTSTKELSLQERSPEKTKQPSAQDLLNNKIKADKEYQIAKENYQNSRASFNEKTKLAQTRKTAFDKSITATRTLAEFSNKGKEQNLAQATTGIEASLGKSPSKGTISQNIINITNKIKTALGLKPTTKEASEVAKIMNEKISFMPKNPTTLQVRQFIQDSIDAFKNLGKEKHAKISTKINQDGTKTEISSKIIHENQGQIYFEKSGPQRLETNITKNASGNIISQKETIFDAQGYVLQENIYNNQGLVISKTTPSIFGGGGLDTYKYTYNQQKAEIGRIRTRTYNDGRTPTITRLDTNNQPIN